MEYFIQYLLVSITAQKMKFAMKDLPWSFLADKIWNILNKNLSSVKYILREKTTEIPNRTKNTVKNHLKLLIRGIYS